MAKDSKRVRRLRRVKRDNTKLMRMLDHVVGERNVYRQMLVDEYKSKIRPDLPQEESSTPVEAPPIIEGDVQPVEIDSQASEAE